MKIRKNNGGSISLIFDADEIDQFLNKCYKPYHDSSTNYFRELYDLIEQKINTSKTNENLEN